MNLEYIDDTRSMEREEIMSGVANHLKDATQFVNPQNIVGIFLQGSQNYRLDTQFSDIDTKLIVVPTFEDICFNKQPHSTTHIRANDEHIDEKDIRLYFNCFRKQNINFVEILFTNYFILMPKYEAEWKKLIENREMIARYDEYAAVSCMKGMAMEKLHALEHPYPSKIATLEKYGYDCYHPDTLFLTKRGWLQYDDITNEDELGTCNPTTLELEWQHYSDRIKKVPTSTVYRCETYNTAFCIMETHNIFSRIVKNRNKLGHSFERQQSEWQLTPMIDCFKNKLRNVLSFPLNNNTDNTQFSDEYLSLFGMFISDGTINFRDNEHLKPKSIRIYQTDNGKIEFINAMNSLITHFNIHSYVDNKKINSYTWYISNSKLATEFYNYSNHGSHNKHLPEWIYTLSKRQANILLHALMLGDGTFSKSRNVYYTSSRQLAYDVCTLAKLAGYTANILGGENGYCYTQKTETNSIISTPCPPMWQVQITKRTVNNCIYFDIHRKNRNGNIHNIDQPNNVVCFTVPNSTLITMFHGKTAVQGNCKQLHHILRLADFIDDYLSGRQYEECLITKRHDYLIDVKNGYYSKEQAEELAKINCDYVCKKADEFRSNMKQKQNKDVDELLDEVQRNIIRIALKEELNKM